MQQESTRNATTTKQPIAFGLLLSLDPESPHRDPNPFTDPAIQEALEYVLRTPDCVSYKDLLCILHLLHDARRYEHAHRNHAMHEWLINQIQRVDELLIPAKHAYYRQLVYAL